MMEVTAMRLLRFTIRVRDQQEALPFYTEMLGFLKRADFPYGDGNRWITVSPPGDERTQLVLQPPEWFSGQEREHHLRLVGQTPTLVFEVEDCQQTHEHLANRGVRFTLPPTRRVYRIEADAQDVDGNTLVFLQLPVSSGG